MCALLTAWCQQHVASRNLGPGQTRQNSSEHKTSAWGAYRTSLWFNALVAAGIAGWALGAGTYVVMAAAVTVWGLGFAATNSMQQVRLVAAAPPLAPASVSLNTSVLYIGQAIGSFIGGLLYAREYLHGLGFVAVAFVALGLMLVALSKPRRKT